MFVCLFVCFTRVFLFTAISDAFTDCLGGLLSVVAQNIRLTIEAGKHTKIKSIDTPYRVVIEDPTKLYRVLIGDLYSEEVRTNQTINQQN
jgi:hypothetical protein